MVELYPGLMLEDIKPARSPGSGLCPPYTLGRAVLADAINLVRSDRFYTVDYNVASLTNWGYNEVQQDYKTLGGSMLYKLIQRGIPGWFPFNSVAVMQPMYTKKKNEEIAKEIGTIKQYTLDDPQPPHNTVVLSTAAAIREVLSNPKQFVVIWNAGLSQLFPGEKTFDWYMLAGDAEQNLAHRASFGKAMSKIKNISGAVNDFIQTIGKQIIEKETFELKKGLNQIDLMRDVAIPLNARLLADIFYLDLKSNENPDGSLNEVS
jgi:linoleate 10R-lipoxygenase